MTICGREHRLATLKRNKSGWNTARRQAHHQELFTGNVVIDKDSGRFERCNVVNLRAIGHFSARDERDLAGQALRVLRCECGHVLLGGEASVHVLVVAWGQLGELGDLFAVCAARTLIGDVAPGRLKDVKGQPVVEGCDGNHGGVGGGFGKDG